MPMVSTSRRLRILLVDDDLTVLSSLHNILEQEGHVVTTAGTGQEGIDAFATALAQGTPFSVVIADLSMPGVHGRKVAESVKALSAQTPVILLTGWGKYLVAEREITAHVDQVLSKPLRLAELREALATLPFPEDPAAAATGGQL